MWLSAVSVDQEREKIWQIDVPKLRQEIQLEKHRKMHQTVRLVAVETVESWEKMEVAGLSEK